MYHDEFVDRYEAQGMELQAEEVEQDQWLLQAVDRDGTIVATLPVLKEVVQELYAAGRLSRAWEPGGLL